MKLTPHEQKILNIAFSAKCKTWKTCLRSAQGGLSFKVVQGLVLTSEGLSGGLALADPGGYPR